MTTFMLRDGRTPRIGILENTPDSSRGAFYSLRNGFYSDDIHSIIGLKVVGKVHCVGLLTIENKPDVDIYSDGLHFWLPGATLKSVISALSVVDFVEGIRPLYRWIPANGGDVLVQCILVYPLESKPEVTNRIKDLVS